MDTVKAKPLAEKLRAVVGLIEEDRIDDAKTTLIAIADALDKVQLLVFGRVP
jgi:hypothetical protein